jgi:hypothetical protein
MIVITYFRPPQNEMCVNGSTTENCDLGHTAEIVGDDMIRQTCILPMAHEELMRAILLTLIISVLGLLSACGKEPQPRSTREFMDQPILLEATMVRCARDRSRTRYEAECINAREAVGRLAAQTEAARREDMDRQSEQKRLALRRAQTAATEARMRAAEQQRLREEDEYLRQFDAGAADGIVATGPPDVVVTAPVDGLSGNQPGVIIQEPADIVDGAADSLNTGEDVDGEASSDLNSVREQLQQRQEPS